ncbi:MAG: hypothetical protein LLG13_07750 [Bacteroidales bacterium]|nr:hypothetical protein [Bacteroidales bacterium]
MMNVYIQYLKIPSSLQKLVFASFLAFSISLTSFPQFTGNYLKKLNEKNYAEELFVQTDRDIYIAGEQVFFKILKLNGLTHTPSDVSKVVYLDLMGNFNNPVVQLKIGADGFSGSGEFMLPDTLRTGNYLIRSCTRWMQNFSQDLFSYKRISIINPFEKIGQIKLPSREQRIDSVIFYPESGYLVSDVETLLGFRCFDKNGDPLKTEGTILDKNNHILCHIKTDINGSGFASIKPSGSGSLYLVDSTGNNHSEKFALPPVQNSGIAFSVNFSRNQGLIKIKILKNNNFDLSGRNLYLVCSPVSMSPLKEEISVEKNTEISLQQNTFPDGLVCITIIDNNDNILAKRWVYNDKTPDIKYSTRLNNTDFSAREKVIIDITANDPNGKPVESDLVVSVVKSFSSGKNSCNNAGRYMQLPQLAVMNTDYDRSDINDYLIYYSAGDDFLKYGKPGSDTIPEYCPELEGHLLSGNIRNIATGEPLKKENISLSFVGKTAQCRFTKTDENGNFNFVVKESGTREIVIQPLSPELNDCYVELNNPFPLIINKYKSSGFYIDSSKIAEINQAIVSMQIKNIYEPFLQTGNIKLKNSDKPDFYGNPDNTIQMSDFIELTSLKEVIKEIVPGVTTYKKNDRSNFKLINKYQNQAFELAPLVLVDGVPVYDFDKVLNINSKDLEKIDVLNTRYFVADIVNEGIINFITKKGNLSVMEFDQSIFRQEFEALQAGYGFSSPDYSTDSLRNSRIPDFRNTLYWNPDVRTDKTGKTTVEFYTSDETGEYNIIVEGFTPEGETGRSVTSFSVRKH